MALSHVKHLFVPSSSNPDDDMTPAIEVEKVTLETLPVEIIILIFEGLEELDATCLGLTSPNMYSIYKAVHPIPPLLTTPCPYASYRLESMGAEQFSLIVAKWRGSILTRPKWAKQLPLCPHSFSMHCQLHHHIRSWMPPTFHFCKTCGYFVEWELGDFRCPCKDRPVTPSLENEENQNLRGSGAGGVGDHMARHAQLAELTVPLRDRWADVAPAGVRRHSRRKLSLPFRRRSSVVG